MDSNRPIFEAIARRVCLEATYNRTAFMLAPHILYTRHDELYVDAVAISRDGQPPREIKIGTFKLTGLKDVKVGEHAFQPEPAFDPEDMKYQGVTLFSVQ